MFGKIDTNTSESIESQIIHNLWFQSSCTTFGKGLGELGDVVVAEERIKNIKLAHIIYTSYYRKILLLVNIINYTKKGNTIHKKLAFQKEKTE